jgi:hypothetical protein
MLAYGCNSEELKVPGRNSHPELAMPPVLDLSTEERTHEAHECPFITGYAHVYWSHQRCTIPVLLRGPPCA